ncbi:GtrA family protein [Candidatus Parcubacteria bacterium]|nr:GtrA family protein [Candidatus Parcubacteria bacterium]
MIRNILNSRYGRIIRYLISGGTAAVVDLGVLYILVHVLRVQYLISAVVGFIVAFGASFIMQKYFTFQEDSKDRIPVELSTYLLVSLINLGLNTLGMYLSVDIMHLQYLGAQFIVNGILAIYSYFVYKYLVFYKTRDEKY